MKKLVGKTLIAAACGLAMSAGAHAATVAFESADPSEFRDIRAVDQSQPRFEQRVLKDLEEHFQKEARMLPEGQTLHVNVTDLDLAGFIEYPPNVMRYPNGLRVIRNGDFPQMSFTYEVRDANGRVLSSGEEDIKDMGFRLQTLTLPRNYDALRYEKAMISKWFDRTFAS